jgi:predicted DCC family thiol-disulfide oxidoreductase YuxK
MTSSTNPQHLVLWDGQCGLCRRAIEWVMRRDTRNALVCETYQQSDHPLLDDTLRAACERAAHVITVDGRVLKAGRASLFVLRELGFRRIAWFLRLPPFIWCVELGYFVVARNRRFFSRLMFRSKNKR